MLSPFIDRDIFKLRPAQKIVSNKFDSSKNCGKGGHSLKVDLWFW